MLFNSYTFAIFFALVCAVYFLNFSWKYKKIFLLLMSYLFYAAWNAPYLLLIIFSTVIDFFAARRIHATDNRLHRRAWLTLSLAGNLGVLSYFKYGAFALENFTALAARFGVIYEPMPWSILLPVGISFYTFQTLSYSIDIFKGRMKPTNNFLDFALFVTFFPQLVAGPIVRARRFMPQLVKQPVVTLNAFGWGLTLIVIGLFSKMVIADGLVGPVVDRIYAIEGTVPAFTALLGAYGFAIQILCDFSGYSLVAIGVAACLGFTLPENFRAPFAATSYTDLWQRWHISMSSWFRDYLYATIRGDNRSFRHMLKTQMITMTVIGLWHGASWTFVVWGAYNGLIMAAESVLRRYFGGYSLWDTAPARVFFTLLTFSLFALSSFLFRSGTFGQAWDMMRSLAVAPAVAYYPDKFDSAVVMGVVGAVLLFHQYIRTKRLEERAREVPMLVRAGLIAGMILAIALVRGETNAFIYFQF